MNIEIAAAWRFVETLIRPPYNFEFYLTHQTSGFDVSFQHPGDRGGQAHAKTVAVAIHRAARKAMISYQQHEKAAEKER